MASKGSKKTTGQAGRATSGETLIDAPKGQEPSPQEPSKPAPRPPLLSNLILHIHPKLVPERTLRFTHTFGLGGMCLALVLLLVATGVLLLFAYEPSASGAYESVASLRYGVPMGQLLRNLHRWGGNCLVVLVFLHLLRVYYTGAYRGPRAANWVVGLLLLALETGENFTGYLLPWDQLAFWAGTIATSMLEYIPAAGPVLQKMVRGGSEMGARTLSIFYILHIVFLPVLLVALLAVHFWLVRKAQGVVLPRGEGECDPGRAPLVPSSPNLTVREGATALLLFGVLLAFSLVVNAPLEAPANPGLSPNPAKAPWYFMGLQELLIHFHPLFAILLIPLAAVLLLVRIPYLGSGQAAEGVWFVSSRGRGAAACGFLFGCSTSLLGILLDEYMLNRPRILPGLPPLLTGGLLPAGALLALAGGFARWLKRRRGATGDEVAQALLTAGIAAFLVLTIVGAGFRGQMMRLAWPWNIGTGAGP